MKFREYIEQSPILTEGLIQKGLDWLIKNTKTFEELYINNQKNSSKNSSRLKDKNVHLLKNIWSS